MKLSVCVVHYHAEDALEKFLESFVAHRPEFLHELLIVDNGSTVDLREWVRDRFGDEVRVIHPGKNIGFGAAHNLAVREAKGEYVLLANADVQLRDRSLEKMLQFAEAQDQLGLVGPRLYYPTGEVQESSRRFPSFLDLVSKRFELVPRLQRHVDRYLMRDVNLDAPTQVDWLVGAVLLMKRQRFLEVGGFDERFFLFFEDTDLCRRLQEKGYQVWYYPETSMTHEKQRLSESTRPGMWFFKKTFWIHLASAGKYFRKWRGRK